MTRRQLAISSLRAKIVLIILGAGIIPVTAVGLWLANGVKTSGEEIVRRRLDSTLTLAARALGESWIRPRSLLLDLAGSREIRGALSSATPPRELVISFGPARLAGIRDAAELIVIRDSMRARWIGTLAPAESLTLVAATDSLTALLSRGHGVTVRYPITTADGSREIGVLEAQLRPRALVASLSQHALLAGTAFGMIDRATGASVTPLPFDLSLVRQGHFQWGGESWLAVSTTIDEPPIELLATASTTPYMTPLENAAWRGILALGFVFVVGVAASLLLARRVTQSLVHLARAADAVSAGDLTSHMEVRGNDEVARVARAFDKMIARLRQMLRERSEREAVSAVGEFAASLAHEIRNPLSSVRLTLQHLHERPSLDGASRTDVAATLADIDRLDRTVGGVLRLARSGKLSLSPTDLLPVLHAAVRSARPAAERRGVTLEPFDIADRPLLVLGNAAALEQVFLNLLLNAVEASPPESSVGVGIEQRGDLIECVVWDEGPGFAAADRERAFDPFFSTKPEGTGLGLTMAARIVAAHGGTIAIENNVPLGARVRVSLPSTASDNAQMYRDEARGVTPRYVGGVDVPQPLSPK